MTADHLFNDRLTDYQLKALEALHSVMTETVSTSTQDPARAKTTIQLLNIRLRCALALLRFKPRKSQAENAPKRAASNHRPEPSLPTPPLEALIPFITAALPAPSPLHALSETRALLERAGRAGGLPQHIPRPAAA